MLLASLLVVHSALAMNPLAANSSTWPAPLRSRLVVDPPVADKLACVGPGGVHLTGWLGHRVDANAQRLLAVDLEPLLAGFRHKPGSHPWIGEHIGKWMHAAVLAWEYTDEPGLKRKLREKLDYAARELIKAQEADGYLGTYVPEQRFGLFPEADWDVWSHKYCLIGLLAYHKATGDAEALAACRRAADLLINTFGPPPAGKRSIITAGTHMGMAATSVLEPIVLLYNATGDRRYLEFAQHIVKSYDDPGGPRLLDSLLTSGSVAKTANGKAYEMLSNVVGLCELYRATGEARYLEAARRAFDDVVANQLYITGTASYNEHFHEGHDLPNRMSAAVGETCVTVTWIQLCEQLLRLTGEAKYADEIERAVYNHLAAAQHPDGQSWCYYTSLDGTKPYTSETCCCLSSGPRGMAMVPSLTLLVDHGTGGDSLVVNLFEPCAAKVTLGGAPVSVRLETEFPRGAGAVLSVTPSGASARFGVKIRVPEWAKPVTTPGIASAMDGLGWLGVAPREWKAGDSVRIDFALAPRVVRGEFGNAGKAAVCFGPLVLAYDQSLNTAGPPAQLVWLTESVSPPASDAGVPLALLAHVLAAPESRPYTATLVPFAEAGADGAARCRVWLGAPGTLDPAKLSVSDLASESRSRTGNASGSIIDSDPRTFVVTYDGKKQEEDWFAVSYYAPVVFRHVVFVHGHTFHDGGWFDASGSPPRVEIQRERDGEWELLEVLQGYPKTSAAEAAGLKGGERFEVKLEKPVRAAAVRIVGTPACGDNPRQAFASCAELMVSGE